MSTLHWNTFLDNPPTPTPINQLPSYTDAIRTTSDAIQAHDKDTIIGLDIETSGLRHWADEIKVVQMHGYPSNKLSILHYPDGNLPKTFVEWMNKSTDKVWVGHNVISFDARFFKSYGVNVTNLNFWDTLIVEGIVNAQHRKEVFGTKNSLQDLIQRYLNLTIPKHIDHSSWQNTLFPQLNEEQLKYAADDVIYLIHVIVNQINHLNSNAKKATSFELYTCKPVLQMATRGLPVDRNRFLEFIEENTEKLRQTRKQVEEEAKKLTGKPYWGGNPDSPTQLLKFLRENNYPLYSTDVSTLTEHYTETNDAFIRAILDHRKISKLNTYDTKWLNKWLTREGTIQSAYNTTGTDTYRLSSKAPNAQNYPRTIRKVFGHPEEWMVVVDYSTVEMRIAAAYMNDKAMLKAFNEDLDIHATTATSLFGKELHEITKDERQSAKAANFAMIFGGGPGSIIRQALKMGLDPITENEARIMRDRFFNGYSDMREFQRNLDQTLRTTKQHEILIGPFGHSRLLQNDSLRTTTALNTPIQGQAAIGMKMTFILIANKYPEIFPYLAANVHDEIILTGITNENTANEYKEILQTAMIEGMTEVCSGVKFEVEGNVAHYWDEAK